MAELFEILLVEDYEPDAQLVLRLFRKNRIANKLHAVHDGIQALDFVFCRGAFHHRHFGNAPLVVILDIRLPKVDGWEVLRQIKQNPRTNGIAVLMTSGSLWSGELEKSRQMGAIGCILKPIKPGELRAALAQAGFVWTIMGEKGA